MPCTLINARARHIPQKVCPDPNACCDVIPSFSSKPVCCDDDFDFTEWTPYDLKIGTLNGVDPTYTLASESFFSL